MPTGVAQTNHVLSRGTYGNSQPLRDKIIKEFSNLENEILNDINALIRYEQALSGSTATQEDNTNTITIEPIGPQVIIEAANPTSTSAGSKYVVSPTEAIKNAGSFLKQKLSRTNATPPEREEPLEIPDNKAIKKLVRAMFFIGGSLVNDPIKSIKGFYYISDSTSLKFLNSRDIVSNTLSVVDYGENETSNSPYPFNSTFVNKDGFISNKNRFAFKIKTPNIRLFVENTFPQISLNFVKKAKLISVIKLEMLNFLKINVFKKQYEDYSFSYQTPLNKKVIDKGNFGNSLYYMFGTEYNYYNEIYENQALTNTVLNERVLPNLYISTDESVLTNTSGFKLSHTTLNNNLSNTNVYDQYYYTNWAIKASTIMSASDLNAISIPLLNTIYQKSDFSTLQDNAANRELFPMFNHIEFTMTNADMNIVEEVNDSYIAPAIYNKLSAIIPSASVRESITGYFTPTVSERLTDLVRIISNEITTTTSDLGIEIVSSSFVGSTKRLISFDLFDTISSSINVSDVASTVPTVLGINSVNYLSKQEIEDDNPLFRIVEPLLIKGRIKNIMNENLRSYKDLIGNNNLVDSETMFYRISKFKVVTVNGRTTNQYIQSYTVPNFQDVTKFISYDTQIKYNNQYLYVVSAYQVVIGTSYEYVNQETNDSSIEFDVINIPILKVVETPYIEKIQLVRDSPPITPEVQLVYFKDIANKIKFMFNSQTGRVVRKPIIINESDVEVFNKAFILQESTDTLTFESEDAPSLFEIYRLETKPDSYRDFSNGIKLNAAPKFKGYFSDFVDTIEPNRKYYYTFRVIDVHNNISNPTEIFELEMINNDGKIYPVINVVDIASQVEQNTTKKMKRFMHIKPSQIQKALSVQAEDYTSAINAEVSLGSASDSVWGKRFKIRVRSKITNKYVDFNVGFERKHIITKDETDLTS